MRAMGIAHKWSIHKGDFLKSGAKIQQKMAEVKTSAKMIKKTNKMMQFLSV